MRHVNILVLALVLALASCTGAALSATNDAAKASDLTATIKSISEATDASAAMTAYAYGLAADRNSAALREAYIRKMIELGQPGLAYEQARELVVLNKDSALGWAVIGFADIERNKVDEAASALARAAFEAPDDPFVQSTCGQLAAWYDSDPNMPGATTITATLIASIRSAVGQTAPFTEGYKVFQQTARQAGDQTPADNSSVPVTPPDSEYVPGFSSMAAPADVGQDNSVTTVLADVPFDQGVVVSTESPFDAFASADYFPFAEGTSFTPCYPTDWYCYDWRWPGPFFGSGFFFNSFCPRFFDRDDFRFHNHFFHHDLLRNNVFGRPLAVDRAGRTVLASAANTRVGRGGLTVAGGRTWTGGVGRNLTVARPFGSSSGGARILGGAVTGRNIQVARPGVFSTGRSATWGGNTPLAVATPRVGSLSSGARGITPAIPGGSWNAGGFNPIKGSRPIPIRPTPPVGVRGGNSGFTAMAAPHIFVPPSGGTRTWTGSRTTVTPSSSTPHFAMSSGPRISAPSTPHFSAPSVSHFSASSVPHFSSAQHFSAPHFSAPHYSAPSHFSGGGGFRGGGSGGGSFHSSGGGGGGGHGGHR